MKVGDIMTKEVYYVNPEIKVSEVARIMFDKNFHGVPVVEEGQVVGIITENDFLTRDFAKVHIPSLIKIIGDLKLSKRLSGNEDDLNNIIAADARSIMTTDFVSVHPETSITELIQIFRDKHVNPIPVVDGDNKLIGIVSKADILNLVGKIREEEIDFIVEK